jgi:hypothetical protein
MPTVGSLVVSYHPKRIVDDSERAVDEWAYSRMDGHE